MSLKEKAPYLRKSYIEEITPLYPNIEDLYEENPYILLDITDELTRLGNENLNTSPTFYDIASNTVIDTFDKRLKQMKAAISWILKENEQEGNSWIKYDELETRVLNLLYQSKHPLLTGSILPYINYYKNYFYYDIKRNTISLFRTRYNEFKIYNGIKRAKKSLLDLSLYTPIDDTNILSQEQLKSAKNIVLKGGNISLLTGGPGTGKTTVTKAIVKGIHTSYPKHKVVLLAPTGKAAKRIQEEFPSEDIEISTIHLYVGWGFEGKMLKNIEQKVKETSVIIVDESSMVGVDVLSKLFELVDIGTTKIIFIGDEHQLPAVGTGDTINDLKTMDVYEEHLYINYRSSEAIIENAGNLNNGDFRFRTDDSFEFIDINTCVAKELLSKEMAWSNKKEVLLSPYRKNDIQGNTNELNLSIHNERYGNRKDYINGFNKGEKVIFNHTNYKQKYFNGDTGVLVGHCIVKEKGEKKEAFKVKLASGDIVKVINEKDIELAYAITIHKSQGSEYDIVNIYIPEYSPFISREMLYTAITRAKKKVRLWTTLDIYKQICLTETIRRNTLISLWKQQENINNVA